MHAAGMRPAAPELARDMSTPIKIDIWSDIACPWCYIGKRRLESAVADFDGDVEVEYHSYELAPDTPEDFAGTHAEYLEQKGFPASQIGDMLARVSGVAETVGLHYDYDANQPTRTLKAHELLHFAKAQGRQVEMKERLLAGYFERGEHVGRIDELVRMAEEVGLDGAAARTALESGEFAAAVQADIQQAAAYGIRGVPFFVIDGKYGISGAQESAVFLNVLKDVASGAPAAG